MAGAVASSNQPSIECQHGHRATQRQKISGVVRHEAKGLFERSDNQATTITLVRLLFRLEAVHRGNVCVLLLHSSRRGSRSNLLIRSQSDHRISGLACDT